MLNLIKSFNATSIDFLYSQKYDKVLERIKNDKDINYYEMLEPRNNLIMILLSTDFTLNEEMKNIIIDELLKSDNLDLKYRNLCNETALDYALKYGMI